MVTDDFLSESVLCSATYNEVERGLLEKVWDEMQEVEMSTPDDSSRPMGGPIEITNDTKLEALYHREGEGEKDMVWGLRFLNVSDDNQCSVIRFKASIALSSLPALTLINRGLHVVVGGDIEFLHTILGLQGCSATYPCFVCETKLSDLQSRQKEPTKATLRSSSRMKEQLEAVEKAGRSEKVKKEAAKKNGSKLRRNILPVDTSRVLLPPLHMILGIVMKLWFNLVKALQGVDENNDIQRRLLTAIRDMMMRHIAVLEEEVCHGKQMVEALETRKKEAL
jgi:hypothetical protein